MNKIEIGWKHSFTLVVFLVFGVFAVGTGDSDSDSTNSAETSFSLSANELYSEYHANEVAADAKYKGKVGEVTGRVRSVGKDILDQMYVEIGGSYLDGVQCTFVKDQAENIAKLKKGQTIKVKGVVKRKLVNVQMDDCILL
ncbi:hypothetical protein EHQ12_08535 [Leptospira gomenensis]|uniref:tRNA_anti-like n=1 Tax=Leptospira gomenensis TaxID=2484974 RepID=A0A5F1YCU4_9LEPT|nr:hypothetical protein [Leptospira gomenensis]TGK35900.1 hypothetical protein EHQ17_04755 [Leptospira gomenensis]TGK40068.1 hypothetical protein EHQ12_08535 [Leptospira gomenensis]TGK51518.1 hypothetical protein EHQ07_02930 [Leptospira gomenensis]TGK68075.1 hypothetical protein EHQ13_01460 [Leptospira gomenensis]